VSIEENSRSLPFAPSKYPPAKPGALGVGGRSKRLEEALFRRCRSGSPPVAEPSGLPAFFSPLLSDLLLTHWRDNFPPLVIVVLCLRELGGSRGRSRDGYSRKCQTSTATPAEPGELPLGIGSRRQEPIPIMDRTASTVPEKGADSDGSASSPHPRAASARLPGPVDRGVRRDSRQRPLGGRAEHRHHRILDVPGCASLSGRTPFG
jgi:hypothetical protein